MQNNSIRAMLVVMAVIVLLGIVGVIIGHAIITLLHAIPLLAVASVVYLLFFNKRKS